MADAADFVVGPVCAVAGTGFLEALPDAAVAGEECCYYCCMFALKACGD